MKILLSVVAWSYILRCVRVAWVGWEVIRQVEGRGSRVMVKLVEGVMGGWWCRVCKYWVWF